MKRDGSGVVPSPLDLAWRHVAALANASVDTPRLLYSGLAFSVLPNLQQKTVSFHWCTPKIVSITYIHMRVKDRKSCECVFPGQKTFRLPHFVAVLTWCGRVPAFSAVPRASKNPRLM